MYLSREPEIRVTGEWYQKDERRESVVATSTGTELDRVAAVERRYLGSIALEEYEMGRAGEESGGGGGPVCLQSRVGEDGGADCRMSAVIRGQLVRLSVGGSKSGYLH